MRGLRNLDSREVVRDQEALASIVYFLQSNLKDEDVFIVDIAISRLVERENVEFSFPGYQGYGERRGCTNRRCARAT